MTFMRKVPLDPSSSSVTNTQLRRFYRMWCLKESIVKALGIGIDFNLASFEFTTHDTELTLKPTLTTTMEVHEPSSEFPAQGWSFEEALLDQDHCYAIAAHKDVAKDSVMDGSQITKLDWNELLKNAVPYPNQYS
ncbi:hypothetical protein BGX28_008331 [Mortierella sp. GBA30]|nr:hypothetical protein BGX28_008331 [Mortierella sp. GBA30]